MRKSILFRTSPYSHLGDKINQLVGGIAGEIETKHFPDGERYLRITTPVRNEDVVILGGTVDDTATLDLFDLACGVVTEGCRSLKMLIPFYGYSTMERSVKKGEIAVAKTRARLLSAIPSAPFGNKVVMLDLHSEGIPFYFEGSIRTRHLYAKKIIIEEAKRMGGSSFVLGAVDAGRAKWVESLANDMGVSPGFVYKRRDQDGKVSVSGVNVSVTGMHVIIYDDMIRSGGSILQAAQAYKEAGAKKISLITTHGVFTGNALDKLKSSGIISEIICTDSHPNALQIKDSILKVVSTVSLFADYLVGEEHAYD